MKQRHTAKKKRGRKENPDLAKVRVSFKPTNDAWSVLGKYTNRGYNRSAIINRAIMFADQEGVL